MDESSLPEPFQRAIKAIRDREVPDALVIAVQDNFAYIDLGTEQLSDAVSQAEARVVVRAPLTFPKAHPYGFVTIPFLTRTDGTPIERQHRDHAQATPVREALGQVDTGFWSWDWKKMPAGQAEDLWAIVEWARKRIRQA